MIECSDLPINIVDKERLIQGFYYMLNFFRIALQRKCFDSFIDECYNSRCTMHNYMQSVQKTLHYQFFSMNLKLYLLLKYINFLVYTTNCNENSRYCPKSPPVIFLKQLEEVQCTSKILFTLQYQCIENKRDLFLHSIII